MTEDEAKTKWCPFARLAGRHNRAENVGPQPEAVACIGSACMAWRDIKKWSAPKYRTSNNPAEDSVLKVLGGYCGLAGEPK